MILQAALKTFIVNEFSICLVDVSMRFQIPAKLAAALLHTILAAKSWTTKQSVFALLVLDCADLFVRQMTYRI